MLLLSLIVLLALLLLSLICCCCKCCRKQRSNFCGALLWNFPIAFLAESFSVVSICCVLNMTQLSWDTKTAIVANSVVSLVIFVLLCVYPIGIQLFLYKNRFNLQQSNFKKKFQAAYSGLQTEQSRYLIYPLMILYRRLTIPVFVLLFPDLLLVQYNWI